MGLPRIPVLSGPKNAVDIAMHKPGMTAGMIQDFFGSLPKWKAGFMDRKAQQWLERTNAPYKEEVQKIADETGIENLHLLNLRYEWGCTTAVIGGEQQDEGPVMYRSMDWPPDGMGNKVILARHETEQGAYWNIAYPGYVGVVQGVAPGRFAVAINQAPIPYKGLSRFGDRSLDMVRMWQSDDVQPTILLRQVFEQCANYKQAVDMLASKPLCISAIFSVTGIDKNEQCIIERQRTDAVVHEGTGCIGNHWLPGKWRGREQNATSYERVVRMNDNLSLDKRDFKWLVPPVLNDETRLAFEANAKTGHLVVQGWEGVEPATQKHDLILSR